VRILVLLLLLPSFCVFAQDPDVRADPNRGLSPHEVKGFKGERKARDIEKEQLAKFISIQGKLIPREKVEALYQKRREDYVYNKEMGMLQPMPLDQFLIQRTGVTAAVLKKARQGAKKAVWYDPYAKRQRTTNLPGRKIEVDDVREISGKVVRRFGPKEVIIEMGGKYMGILSENSVVEDQNGFVSRRVFKTVKAKLTRKVRIGTENLSIPMYKDVTLTEKDFAFWARREFAFTGLGNMLEQDAVSPDVARKLSRPWLESSNTLNPKK